VQKVLKHLIYSYCKCFHLKFHFVFIVTTAAEDNKELFRMVKNYLELTRKQLSR